MTHVVLTQQWMGRVLLLCCSFAVPPAHPHVWSGPHVSTVYTAGGMPRLKIIATSSTTNGAGTTSTVNVLPHWLFPSTLVTDPAFSLEVQKAASVGMHLYAVVFTLEGGGENNTAAWTQSTTTARKIIALDQDALFILRVETQHTLQADAAQMVLMSANGSSAPGGTYGRTNSWTADWMVQSVVALKGTVRVE